MTELLVATPATLEREADKRLFLELRGRLWDYEPLRATGPSLEVEVEQGVVRLAGRVRTQAMKEIVGYLCRRVDGVVEVNNELISDPEVIRAVADTLAADPELAPLCLRVDVRDGVVTLGGDIPAPELEARAIEVARGAPGVVDVVSEMAVRQQERPPTAPLPKPPQAAETATAASSGA